jgi:hypothetical protein
MMLGYYIFSLLALSLLYISPDGAEKIIYILLFIKVFSVAGSIIVLKKHLKNLPVFFESLFKDVIIYDYFTQ